MKASGAIETVYRGFRFRSRLEARWAIFFDVMGEEWEYEKEGYQFDDMRYLPDFFLPRIGCFVEIKGQPPTAEEMHKAERLRDVAGHAVMIFHGIPLANIGKLYCWDATESSGGTSDFNIQWCDHDWGYLSFWVDDSYSDRSYFMSEYCNAWNASTDYCYAGKTGYAAECAKAARFEYGENKDYREPRPIRTESEDDLPW